MPPETNRFAAFLPRASAADQTRATMLLMPSSRELGVDRGWLLDEIASAGRENLDKDHVSRYDSKEDASSDEEVLLHPARPDA